ncbi:MAG TPA: hypothetical protein VKI61_02270 [Chitinophagaceae bacterium]|nr:hypothetical protein [Chitinophagaceae bacterium]
MEELRGLTLKKYLIIFAQETARMSYPGGMSRGKKQIVKEGAKKIIQLFLSEIDLSKFWKKKTSISQYKKWHSHHSNDLSRKLTGHLGNKNNNAQTVASKFLETFMQLLLRKREFESLRSVLYLPIDSVLVNKLKGKKFKNFKSKYFEDIKRHLRNKTAYELDYETYVNIQHSLMPFLIDLNRALATKFKLKNRIDLNILWSMK